MDKKRSTRLTLGLALVAMGLLLVAAFASATTVVPLELPQMVESSELIVVARSTKAESVWVGRTLFTRYTVEVEETLDGEALTAVQVLVPGGVDRRRGIGMSAAGAPAFLPDERSVLLLRRLSPARVEFGVVGFNQGKFVVTGDRVEARSLAAPGAAATEPLSNLRERLRELVQQRGSAATDGSRARVLQ